MPDKLPKIFEDESLLVLDKPAMLHSVKLPKSDSPSLAEMLLAERAALAEVSDRPGDAGLIQRLDFGTSGLIIAAKTTEVWHELRRMLQAGEISKKYLALVEGKLLAQIEVENYIGSPNRGGSKVRVYEKRPPKSQRALPAKTTFVPDARFNPEDFTLVEVLAPTARRHQIRAHAAFLGHPLIGDTLYGSQRSLAEVFTGPEIPEFFPEFFLHAAHTALKHPLTGLTLNLVSNAPAYARGIPAIGFRQ